MKLRLKRSLYSFYTITNHPFIFNIARNIKWYYLLTQGTETNVPLPVISSLYTALFYPIHTLKKVPNIPQYYSQYSTLFDKVIDTDEFKSLHAKTVYNYRNALLATTQLIKILEKYLSKSKEREIKVIKGDEEAEEEIKKEVKKVKDIIEMLNIATPNWGLENAKPYFELDESRLAIVKRIIIHTKTLLLEAIRKIKKHLNVRGNYGKTVGILNVRSLAELPFIHPLDIKYLRYYPLISIKRDKILQKGKKSAGRENKYRFYIDISGSMEEQIGGYTKLSYATAIAIAFKLMGYDTEVFYFNTAVYNGTGEIRDLLSVQAQGGTDINAVLNHIQQNPPEERKIVIITDGISGIDASLLNTVSSRWSLYSIFIYDFNTTLADASKKYVHLHKLDVEEAIKILL